ncbi:hypothetical protein REPUB_Repub18cG0160000 [Reevesia pubescens]
MKVLVWKGCQRALPVLANLVKRRVAVEGVCFRCQECVETELHALRDCTYSREVWTHLGFIWVTRTDGTESLIDWISSVFNLLNLIQIQTFICTC